MEGELVTAHPQIRGLSVKEVALDGDTLRVVLKSPDITFEGRVPKAGADTILGTFESGGRFNMARVAITDKTTLTPATTSVSVDLPEPMQKVQTLTREVTQLRQRIRGRTHLARAGH